MKDKIEAIYYKHTGYHKLAVAICLQAVEDYQAGCEAMRADCIRFFKSPWFTMLSGLHERDIITKLHKRRRRKIW